MNGVEIRSKGDDLEDIQNYYYNCGMHACVLSVNSRVCAWADGNTHCRLFITTITTPTILLSYVGMQMAECDQDYYIQLKRMMITLLSIFSQEKFRKQHDTTFVKPTLYRKTRKQDTHTHTSNCTIIIIITLDFIRTIMQI